VLKSPNHQGVQALSSKAARISCVPHKAECCGVDSALRCPSRANFEPETYRNMQ
jgi:hypothetical protein